MPELDHTNRPVPDDESPETVIKVWRVRVEPDPQYDSYLIRGWQAMLDLVRDKMEQRLELDFEPTDDVEIGVSLVEMTRQQYDELREVDAY